jgi:lipoate-protein ligase A
MDWTLIVESSGRPGSENMSIDCSLLRAAQEGVAFLRLYSWTPPCLSFGRNEPARLRYDPAEIARLGLDTVRRPTGGRAVWHGSEVTYAVAAPASTFGALRESYNIIHTTIADALRHLGVATDLAGRSATASAGISGGACFASPVGGEVVAAGRKLVGSAQVREGDAFLQHGSVLLEDDQDMVAKVTLGKTSQPVATSVSGLLGRRVSFEEVAEVIGDEARKSWPGTWKTGEVPRAWQVLEPFSDPAWTWRR